MTLAARLEALCAAIEAELAALERDDLDALADATRAKLQLIEEIRAATPAEPLPADMLARARDLNREAGRRVNLARASVERRLQRLARAKGASAPLTYGPNGRVKH